MQIKKNIHISRSLVFYILSILIMFAVICTPNVNQTINAANESIVSTQNEIEHKLSLAQANDSVTFLIDGRLELDHTLIIPEYVEVTLLPVDSNSTLVPSSSMNPSKSLIEVSPHTTLNIGKKGDLVGLVIDGLNYSNGALIENRGTLNLYEGTITGAKGDDPVINGGAIYNIGIFTMYGGLISGNAAYGGSWSNGGGGIYTVGMVVMFGGVIENNTAFYESIAGVDGGLGGGIYVANGEVEIYGGNIRNNKAGSGGGIYVHGETNDASGHAKLYLYNALITENLAYETGGGLWLCATGSTQTTLVEGSAILKNLAEGTDINKVGGDDVYSDAKSDPSFENNLPQKTLTGDTISWYYDKPNSRYKDTVDPQPLDTSNLEITENSYYHAEAIGADLSEIRALSSVIIENNEAIMGGGIAANGVVSFGTSDNETSVQISKVWEDSFTTHSEIEVQLYRYLDLDGNGKIDTNEMQSIIKVGAKIVLNEANNYTIKVSSLPKYLVEDGNFFEYSYYLEEITKLENYILSYNQSIFDPIDDQWEIEFKNTFVEETTDLEIIKVWEDNSNEAGLRPETIEVAVYADGFLLEDIELTWIKNGNVWTAIISNLAVENAGQPIIYTVIESPVEEYKTTYDGLKITNTYIPINPEPQNKPGGETNQKDPDLETLSQTGVENNRIYSVMLLMMGMVLWVINCKKETR